MSLPNIDDLANAIRTVDGGHALGAGALAEALQPWLAEHDRQIKAEAWAEGNARAKDFPNPYTRRPAAMGLWQISKPKWPDGASDGGC